MKLTIKDTKGQDQGELEVKFPLIEDGKGTQAVHDAVVAYRASQRMGTACTKNVGEVAGTSIMMLSEIVGVPPGSMMRRISNLPEVNVSVPIK